jgi:FtsH-binding integral membrane protein
VTVWPWTLTPLTAQVLGAIFFLGIAGLGALAGRRWSSARTLLQVAALMLTLILVAGIRASGELDPSNAMTWLIGGGFAVVLAAIVTLYLRTQARQAASPPPEPAR